MLKEKNISDFSKKKYWHFYPKYNFDQNVYFILENIEIVAFIIISIQQDVTIQISQNVLIPRANISILVDIRYG